MFYHHQAGVGHVHADFDHRGGNENRQAAVGEVGHDSLAIGARHLAVSEADLKVMRARYLVTRGESYKRLRSMPQDERNVTLHTFFPGGVWVPREGSEMSEAMGMEASDGRLDKAR